MSTAPVLPASSVPEAPKESLLQKIEGDFSKDEKKIATVLEIAGKDFAKGLTFLTHYLPEGGALATLLFPEAGPEIAAATEVTDLIQKSVVAVEAQYAASGINTEAGTKKAADVVTLVEGVALPLIKQVEPNANTAKVQQIIDAVVAVLNVRTVAVAA